MTEKTTVAIIYGGRSTEHSISCITAGSIIQAIDKERYDVIPVGITRAGKWVRGSLDPVAGQQLPEVTDNGQEVTLSVTPATKGQFRDAATGELLYTVDVVFPVLHGTYGEDGTIQGLFELSDIPYVGCGVVASSCGMDKEFTKKIVAAQGIPVTKEVILHDGKMLDRSQLNYLGLPVFVKPARGGSSIGISKATTEKEVIDAIFLAYKYDTKVIVEAELHGPEVEVGVLQYPDGKVVASVPAELVGTDTGSEGFYGFEAKYIDQGVSAAIPARIGAETTERIRNYAIQAFKALDGAGLARVDFFATPEGPRFNEINTMPGFTSISMYPKVFEASGVAYPELIDILIQTALAKKKAVK